MQIALGLLVCALAGAGLVYLVNARGRAPAGDGNMTGSDGVVGKHRALVTTLISPQAAGGITYSVAGERRDIAARNVDETSIEPGTAVLIERIDGPMAFVSVIP